MKQSKAAETEGDVTHNKKMQLDHVCIDPFSPEAVSSLLTSKGIK